MLLRLPFFLEILVLRQGASSLQFQHSFGTFGALENHQKCENAIAGTHIPAPSEYEVGPFLLKERDCNSNSKKGLTSYPDKAPKIADAMAITIFRGNSSPPPGGLFPSVPAFICYFQGIRKSPEVRKRHSRDAYSRPLRARGWPIFC